MVVATQPPSRLKFNWILSKKQDLTYYIGSALIGYLYLFIILIGILMLHNPETDSFVDWKFIHVDLNLLVVVSWGIFLDAPHLFATLARTLFDPDEWQVRKPEILKSWIFFFVGPIAILSPYLVGSLFHLSDGILVLGYFIFIVFFRLWAYYHIVRQHWGFFRLYKRTGQDYSYEKLDFWFFNLTMYLPLAMFLTSSYYPGEGAFPNLGLQTPIFSGISIGMIANPILWVIYLGILSYYIIFHLRLYRSGQTLNGSKLFYMALIVPLHFLVFINPILAFFVVPLVTVGHNIQYHMIVYSYGKKKYYNSALTPDSIPKYKWARLFFSNIKIYFVFGLLFTLFLYRGPLFTGFFGFSGLSTVVPLNLDKTVFNSIGMMAGIRIPAELTLGEKVFGSFLLGWAMQHYYLDSKIWRVSKDKSLQKNLNV